MTTTRHKKPRPRSIRDLREQLSRPLADPKGDRLRSKISSVEPSGAPPEWRPWSSASPRIIEGRGPKPNLGQHLCVVSTLDSPVEILLIYHGQDSKPLRFMVVPHPGEL